ncbi:MAG: DUF2213 domain-containing protein [Candidatus Sabulitectum sp.]|nr:DUF2213 domain-containing protein [Candidatus Sabulitectum sp.]
MRQRTMTKLRDFNSGKIQVSDNVTLPATSTRELTPEGYLKATAAITMVGVQMYPARDFGIDSDELVGVLRPKETVFHPETISTIKLKPITLHHPQDDVDSKNFNRLTIGTVGETVEALDSEHLGASIQIMDDDVVKKVLAREIDELSLGYDVWVISEEGTFNGAGYLFKMDGPMTNNHLAVVPEGRCGDSVKILDKGESIMWKKLQAIKALRDAGVPEGLIKTFMVGQADDAEVDVKAYTKLAMSAKDIDMTQLIPGIIAELKPAIEEMVGSEEFKATLAKEIAAGMVGGAATPATTTEGADGEGEGEPMTTEQIDAAIVDGAAKRAVLIGTAKLFITDENFDISTASDHDILVKSLDALDIKGDDIAGKDDTYLAGMLAVISKDRAEAGTFMKQDFRAADGVALAAPMTGIGARKLIG